MSTIVSLHDLPKELVDLIAKAVRDLKSWLNLRLTCKQCWASCSLEQYRVQFLVQIKLKRETYFRLPNGLRHGEFKTWHENGQLFQRSFYRDGKLEGKAEMWYRNGQLWVYSFFKDGKLEGEYKMWYKTGQLRWHRFYKNGKLQETSSQL
jgi:antitoxin component YwqK of YwqJK toxin-antitoxin module